MRVLLALVAVLAGGCEKAKSSIPDEPQPKPAALVATVALPSASGLVPFRDVVAAIYEPAAMAVDPAIVTMTATSGVGAPSLEVIDPAAPMYGLWLDDGKVRGLAIVGKIKNEDARDKLKPAESADKNGWIVVAQSKELLALVAPYALTTLVATAPTRPTGTIYVPNVVARYNDKIVAMRNTTIRRVARSSPLDAASAAGYIDGLVGAFRDTDEIRIALEPGTGSASFDVTIIPKSGGKLAGFVAAQKPSDMSLATKLPDKIGAGVVTGRLVLGPYQTSIIQWIAGLYGDPFGAGLVDSYLAIIGGMSGEIAVAGSGSPEVTLYMLAELADPASLAGALDKVQAVFKASSSTSYPGGTVTYRAGPDITADGVTLHVDETAMEPLKPDPKGTDPKAGKPEPAVPTKPVAPPRWAPPVGTVRKVAVGVVDKLLLVCGTPNATDDATRGIQIARGKAPGFAAPPELVRELAAAKARKDSLVAGFDATMIVGKGVATASLGFADKTIHLRVTLPTAAGSHP